MGKPINKNKKMWEAFKEAYGIEPTNVNGQWNARTEFHKCQLQRIAFGIVDIDYNAVVNTWDKDYIREGLLLKGVFTVTEDNDGILLPLKCGISGVNVFNRGTDVIIANPVVGSFERTIGKDCEIVYLQQKQGSRFRSLTPIIDVYAQRLANCDAAIDINLFNTRLPYIFQASSTEVAESFKAMYDEISQGNPAVFIDENIGKLLQNQDGSNLYMFKGKENFISDLVQNEKLAIMDEFKTLIGINSANTTKRERMIVDEVNSNNIEVEADIKLWVQNVNDCVNRVNKMFPTAGLKITFPFYERMKEQSVSRPKGGGSEDDSNRRSDNVRND